MGWFSSLKHAVSSAADSVGDAVSSAATTVADTASSAASAVADTASSAASAVADAATSVVSGAESAIVSAWEATSSEAEAIAQGIESVGMTIGTGFVNGAKYAAELMEEGVSYTEQGLVEAGKYVSSHACDIALGSALGAIFVAAAADGEEEATMASFAAAVAIGTVEKAELQTAADAVAAVLGPAIWEIPGVSDTLPSKSTLESLIAFVLVKLGTENPELVVGTAGQVIAGVLIAIITDVVCDGKLPGGFSV